MELPGWILFALLGSLFQAAFVETNRIARADARLLNFWHVIMVLVLFVPLTPYMAWPDDTSFYALALAVSVGMGISTQILFALARAHNGRVSSMYMPLEVVVAYGLWFAFYPPAMEAYQFDSYRQTGVFLAFCLFSISLLLIRRNDIGWNAFMAVIPIAIFFGLRAVFSKIAMMGAGEDIIGHTLSFTFIVYLGIVPLAYLLILANGGFARAAPVPPFKAGFLCAFFALAAFLCYTLGVTLASNPAYVVMTFMLVPVWLLLLHIVTGVRDDASPWAGTVMIAGAAVLIWFAA